MFQTSRIFFLALALCSSALAFTPRSIHRRTSTVTSAVSDPNPVVKTLSAGMGLISPLFVLEGKVQAAALGKVAGFTYEDAVSEVEQSIAGNKVLIYTYALSPFSTEAVALLESTGYEFTKIELGLEWFTLGGRGSQIRVALADKVENGATSLPKIFIGGKPLEGASGYSALAKAAEDGTLEERLKAAGAKRI